MKPINRREFLRMTARTAGAASLGGAGLLNAHAAIRPADQSGYRALVCIFLTGGNDGHNTVIPVNIASNPDNQYAAYYQSRPDLAIPLSTLSTSALEISPASNSSDVYALHPALVDVAAMFQNGSAAILANTGNLTQPTSRPAFQAAYLSNPNGGGAIPASLFSHSDQVVQWQNSAVATSGWGGRVASYFAGAGIYQPPSDFNLPMNVAFGTQTPFAQGSQGDPLTLPTNVGTNHDPYTIYGVSERSFVLQTLLTFPSGLQMVQASDNQTLSGLRQHELLAGVLDEYTVNLPFPGDALGAQLKLAAALINASKQRGVQRQIFFVTLGNFDLHSNQMAEYGGHTPLLTSLNNGLSAFRQAMLGLGLDQNVTVFTNSEFGRTLQQSGSGAIAGSDHAWGSHHFIIGGAVKGGDFYGTFPTLAVGGPDDAFAGDTASNAPPARGVLLPTTSVAQYGATLAKWFGVPDDGTSLQTIFPNLDSFAPNRTLGFL